MYRFLTTTGCTPTAGSLIALTTLSCKRYTGNSSTTTSKGNTTRSKGISFNKDEGISKGLGGFGHYAGSITAFMKTDAEKKRAPGMNEPLPCSVAGSQASLQAMQAKLVEEAALTGSLPSPRRAAASAPGPPSPKNNTSNMKKTGETSPTASAKRSSLPRVAAQEVKRPPAVESPLSGKASSPGSVEKPAEVEEYYRSIPDNPLTKEELWQRVKRASAEQRQRQRAGAEAPFVINAEEVDYIRMEEDLKEIDPLHHSLGELAYPEEGIRRNYYAMWYLAIALNKARWSALEVQSQRGVKSTGAGMKLMFWKDAVNSILERKEMLSGQFTESHPILRPFGAAVASTPGLTKAFARGFTDARLRIFQQPGNIKQLFDHFDKFYGYFFYSLLELTTGKDENAEHLLLHIGRALGLVLHSVMLWKKYVRLGITMLPADLCADNHVNLVLLKNIPLASRDGGVKKLLYDVLCIAKTELLHAQKLAPLVPPKVWPIVMEVLYPNYYLGFLQRRNLNVSAMFADYNIENPGLVWFRLKKRWEWERYQSIEKLLSEEAPLPWINISLLHSPSRYKMANKEKE